MAVVMRYGTQQAVNANTQAPGATALAGLTLIASVYNATYTFTDDYSNVMICGTSGRPGDARSELTTTAPVAFQGYWRTSGTQGSLTVILCNTVAAGDTVRISNGYGYPCIFVFQMT